MIVAILNIYLVLLFLLVWFKHRSVQPVLEDLAADRACCC